MTPPALPARSRLRFLVTPRWIGLEVVVVLFVLACYFLLAPWQFARSHQHDAEMNAIATAVATAPAEVSTLLSPDREQGSAAQWRAATATGHFDDANQSYIRLRQDNDGNPAYEVVVPFVTDSGTVLVDRGYVPYQAVQEGTLRMPELPAGTVTVTGRVQPDQTDPKNRAPVTAPDGRTAYTEVSSKNVSSSGPVYRGYLQLMPGSTGVIEAIALPRNDSSRPFFSYAIQWLSFGAIAVLGLVYFAYREYRDPVDGAIYVARPGAAATADLAGDREPRARPAGLNADARDAAVRNAAARDAAVGDAADGRRKFDKSQLYDE